MTRILMLLLLFTATLRAADESSAQAAIREVMAQQQADWNSGNIDAFMQGYLRSEEIRFASGGTVTKGWAATIERYHTHYDTRAKMGQLQFDLLSIEVFSADSAVVFGRWELTRAPDEIKPNGLFTLVFRHTSDGWRIVHDHTSSADP